LKNSWDTQNQWWDSTQVAGRHWVGEGGGVFTFVADRATPIHYRRDGGRGAWTWSPDRVNWMACDAVAPAGARWRAQSLVEANRQIAAFLLRHDPRPPPWRERPTTVSVSVAAGARPPSRARDDARAERAAARNVAPDAHGGILALSQTHVHVVHGAFAPPAHILRVDRATIAGHAGGWLHSNDAGASWDPGLGGAAAAVRDRRDRRGADDDDDAGAPPFWT